MCLSLICRASKDMYSDTELRQLLYVRKNRRDTEFPNDRILSSCESVFLKSVQVYKEVNGVGYVSPLMCLEILNRLNWLKVDPRS